MGRSVPVAAHLEDRFFSRVETFLGLGGRGVQGRPESCLAEGQEASTPTGGAVLVVEPDVGTWRDPKEKPRSGVLWEARTALEVAFLWVGC